MDLAHEASEVTQGSSTVNAAGGIAARNWGWLGGGRQLSEHIFDILAHVHPRSTPVQRRHGTAMRYAAERRNLGESIEELRQLADGRSDILAEAAGITAGSWCASPATHQGYELIGAGMLSLAGGGRGLPMDYHELERWTPVGYERGMASRRGER